MSGKLAQLPAMVAKDGRFVWRLLGRHRLGYVAAMLGVMAAGMALALAPYVLGKLVDAIAAGGAYQGQRVALIGLGYAFLQLFSASVAHVGNLYLASLSERLSHRLRVDIARKIVSARDGAAGSVAVGEASVLFSRDVEVIWDLTAFAIGEAVNALILLLTMQVVLFTISPLIGVVVAVFDCLFLVFYYMNGVRVRGHFAKVAPINDRMLEFVAATVRSVETVIGFRRQAWIVRQIAAISAAVTVGTLRAHRATAKFGMATSFSVFLLTIGFWGALAYGLFGTSLGKTTTLGDFVAVMSYLGLALGPLETIAGSAKVLTKSSVAIDRLAAFFAAGGEVAAQALAPSVPDGAKAIRLDHVAFADGDMPVLKDVDMRLETGSVVALAGRSGSGKTTLLRLLAGLIRPTAGHIRVEAARAGEAAARQGRSMYLAQETVLFPVSFDANVTLGRRIDALRLGSLVSRLALVERRAELLGSEWLSEAELSGGEKQRIGLLRALAEPAPLYLLDEPSSALDYANTQVLMDIVDSLKSQGAIFVIATHDPVILSRTDRVFYLSGGGVAASGTHDQLAGGNAEYARVISGAESR